MIIIKTEYFKSHNPACEVLQLTALMPKREFVSPDGISLRWVPHYLSTLI